MNRITALLITALVATRARVLPLLASIARTGVLRIAIIRVRLRASLWLQPQRARLLQSMSSLLEQPSLSSGERPSS